MNNESLNVRTAAELKKARQRAGFTMQSLAQKLGVSRVTVTRWESGKENLTLQTVERICEAIGIEGDFRVKRPSGRRSSQQQ